MGEVDTVDYNGRFEYVAFDQDIPEGDFSRFVVMFIKTLLKSFNLENEIFHSAEDNKKRYALHKMVSLVYYAYARGFTKASIIADFAKNHKYFRFVGNGIEPNEDTINLFIYK